MDDNKIAVAGDANEVDDTVAAVSAVSVTAASDITDDDDTPASRESTACLPDYDRRSRERFRNGH